MNAGVRYRPLSQEEQRNADVASDRRRYSLALTATGRARMEALRARLDAYEARPSAQLSAAERAQLVGLLERVAPAQAAVAAVTPPPADSPRPSR